MSRAESNTIIDDHRNMLMFSKNLSQFQINNMNGWVHVFFTNVEKADVSWNFIDGEGLFCSGSVNYDLTLGENEETNIACNYLILATKTLFWEQTEVIIKINGELWNKK